MDSLKRKRAAQAGTITRIHRKLQKVQAEDLNAMNIPQLNRQLASLETANEAYKQLHADLEEQFREDVDEGEEEEILSQHLDAYEEAETLAHLLHLASALNDAQSIMEQIKELEQMIEDYPDKSYEQAVQDLKTRLDKLRADADCSSIPQGHEVRHLISGLSSAMANLTATQKKPPSSTSAHCSSDCSTSSKSSSPYQHSTVIP